MTTPETRFSLIGRLHDAEDTQAWNEFVEIYQPMIFGIARRRGLQHADAAEVTQEVMSRVARSIHKWEPDRSKGTFRGWLYRITRNLTIDYLRNVQRRPGTFESRDGVSIDQLPGPPATEAREFHIEFERRMFAWAAGRIQPRFHRKTWQAFWKSAVEGIAVQTVAQELEMTPGAGYVARSRVMKRLTREVEQRMDESMQIE